MSTSSVPSWGFFPGSCGQMLAEQLFYFEGKNMAVRKLWCQEHEAVAVSAFPGRKQRKHGCRISVSSVSKLCHRHTNGVVS